MSAPPRPLDHSEGRAHLLNGVLYYSPNSSRSISPPPPKPPHFLTSGIFHVRSSRHLEEYQHPRWWTAAYGYLSFLPMHPSFVGYPFDRLAHIPPLERDEGGFYVSASLASSWFRLQQKLKYAICVLAKKYPATILLPWSPSAWGYGQRQRSHYIARQRAVISRDWFVILMAGLSFLIAVGESQIPDAPIPDWFTQLAEAGLDQSWLAGVATSSVRTFSPFAPRVGVFLDILDPEKTQPAVEWFCRYYVPVWYPWGADEVQALHRKSSLASLAPPPHKLQEATTFITRTPSVSSPDNATPDTSDARPAKAHPTWKEFFAEREKLNAQKLGNETPSARQTRLNRERNPPTVSAKVFEWAPSDEIPSKLVRKAVLQRARAETLENYGANQRRYDAFWNEWDCCEEFGPDDRDDDEVDGHDEDFWGPRQEECIQPDPDHDPPIRIQRSPSPPPIADDVQSANELPDMYEIVHLLSMHHGFVLPVPVPSHTDRMEPQAVQDVLRVVGLKRGDDPIFKTDIGVVAFNFVQTLASGRQPIKSLWDLDRDSRQPLALTGRIKRLRRLPSGLYIFDFGGAATVPWKIAVPEPADVLYICRLDAGYHELDITRNLLQRGIQFRTLQPLRDIPRSRSSDPLIVPFRLSGYKFSKRDYDAYLHQRAVVLGGRGGRAALLRGGILWRLAVQETSFETVLQGPSSSVLLHRDGFSVEDRRSASRLWDDDLSEEEIHLVCGTYICYTGHGDQTALVSWFPLPSTYEWSGENYGRWTELAEESYQTWLARIDRGEPPLPQNQWRDRMRGFHKTRKFKKATSKFSAAFLQAQGL